jgi:hypothetical protein
MFWARLDEGHASGVLAGGRVDVLRGEELEAIAGARRAPGCGAGGQFDHAERAQGQRQPPRHDRVTSMGKRMKKVCTPPHGAITRPAPASSRSRPSSPFFRVVESKAASSRDTRTLPEVRLRTLHAWSGEATSGARKWLTAQSALATR